ncbi:Fpg/Nei family DNA glycosylase [Actinophytocola sp.]|uniref:Fpg/Nei family DNA glycosylase n=1 Tax=Actinophytocola sp. TaxID=1872138 RepID=UPI003D6A6292
MPELPDVEGFRRVLAAHTGARIRRVDVLDAQMLRGVGARGFGERLRGKSFAAPRRHGKWLVGPLRGGGAVLVHFGMTGDLRWTRDGERHPHDRVAFVLDGGELRYRDMRKLQGIRLADDDAAVERILAEVGPDATDVGRDELRELLDRRRQVKPTLTDQAVLGGIGNLLADEILWRARINPRRPGNRLSAKDVTTLHTRLRSVLRQAVAAGRVPPRTSWLTGRRDEPSGSCPRCVTTLHRGRVGGRGTVWCPNCQPG